MNVYEILNKNNIQWAQIGNEQFPIAIQCPFCRKATQGDPYLTFSIDQSGYGNCSACSKITDWDGLLETFGITINQKKEIEIPSTFKTASPEIIRKKLDFTSISNLLDEPEEETNWIVDGLLPSSGFSIMVAKPKVGKSTLVRQLALCVAQGGVFLGRHTTKGLVLYVALEEKRSEVRHHFKILGADGSEDLEAYIGSAPDEANEWLTREVKKRKPVLVIIDTLFRFARVTDVSDYAKVTVALDPLLALARENNAHLMVIHHARKGGGEGGDSTLGSTAIFGSVDTSIILKKTDGRRTIETQQRYGVDMEPTLLVFDDISKSVDLGGTKEEDDTKKIETEILECLKTKDEPLAEPDVLEEIEGRTALKRKALRHLFTEGEISRSGAGKRNDPFLYSCSLVPTIYTGREKQETKSEENLDSSSVLSCSQDLPFNPLKQ